MRWRFLECRTIVDSLTLLTFIIFLSLLNYKVKTFHFLQQNYEHTTFLLLLVTTSHPVAVPVGLFTLQSVAGDRYWVLSWFLFTLSPYCGSGSVLAGFRLPGLRDHHRSRSRVLGGAAWRALSWAWARLKKEKSNNRQKNLISCSSTASQATAEDTWTVRIIRLLLLKLRIVAYIIRKQKLN